MAEDVGKMWYLKKIDLFDRLDEEQMDELSDFTHVQDVPSGQTIYLPGDQSDTVFMLKKGKVKLTRQSPEGKSITIAILESGELFGELSLTGETERRTRAETMENSYICSSPKDKFLEVVEANPKFSLEIAKMIGERRRKIEARVENLIFRNSRGRVAYMLKQLFENHSDDADGLQRTVSFTHQDIADLTGLTRPTTSNELSALQEDNIIELNRGQITLRAPDRLEAEI